MDFFDAFFVRGITVERQPRIDVWIVLEDFARFTDLKIGFRVVSSDFLQVLRT